MVIPEEVPNLIGGRAAPAAGGGWFEKHRPADGSFLCRAARSGDSDVAKAVAAARQAQPGWAARTPVER
ncbi:MAG: aldehyde dehydrogenase family protein, partial [Gaiellaceae bacterium]